VVERARLWPTRSISLGVSLPEECENDEDFEMPMLKEDPKAVLMCSLSVVEKKRESNVWDGAEGH
jgi:hypothetical protein